MGRLPTCVEHGLAFDPSVSSGCVLCRQAARSHLQVSKSRGLGTPTLLAILAVLVGSGALLLRTEDPAPKVQLIASAVTSMSEPTPEKAMPAPVDLLPPLDGRLSTKNTSNRSGVFFLPERSVGTPLPVLVALHGQGGDGASIQGTFRALAGERHFVIVAPSSNYAAEVASFTWTVGDKPNDITPDYLHVKACFDEVAARPDVTFDRGRVLAVGFSGGASSAPYVATNATPYSAFAVLHGGVFIGGVGPRKVRGWFSTGASDPARTPDHVKGHFQTMRESGFDVVFHVYPGGHGISQQESADVVGWWLGGG